MIPLEFEKQRNFSQTFSSCFSFCISAFQFPLKFSIDLLYVQALEYPYLNEQAKGVHNFFFWEKESWLQTEKDSYYYLSHSYFFSFYGHW